MKEDFLEKIILKLLRLDVSLLVVTADLKIDTKIYLKAVASSCYLNLLGAEMQHVFQLQDAG